jgi:hypothetical protein
MRAALSAATAYFLILFALGFVLGTIRVLLIAPRFGALAATVSEVPVMITAGYFTCRRVLRRWHVPADMRTRWAMVMLFLLLLAIFETLLGALLFGRTVASQWVALATPAGLVGVSAQIVAALLPVFFLKTGDNII